MTTIIRIAYEADQAAVQRVQSLLDEVTLSDPNWNGAHFEIERDDFTSMDDQSYNAAALFARIQSALAGHD